MPFDPNYRPKAITEEMNNLTFEPKTLKNKHGLVRNQNGQLVRYNLNKDNPSVRSPEAKTSRPAHTTPLELF